MIFLHKRKKLRFHIHEWINKNLYNLSNETNLLDSLIRKNSTIFVGYRLAPSCVRFIDFERVRNIAERGNRGGSLNAAEIQDHRKWKSDREPRPPHWKQFSRQMFRDGVLRFATTRPLDVHP